MILVWALIFFVAPVKAFKILHIAFHKGCLNDIKSVVRTLNDQKNRHKKIKLESWFIHDDTNRFEGLPHCGDDIYNIHHLRAKRVWEKNKNYFLSFDLIITSDTAPLSRIFLENNCPVPLIIWVCNRFDYSVSRQKGVLFPDAAYYTLIQDAAFNKNVRIVSYTDYEHVYAKRKGVNIGTQVIRPIGSNIVKASEEKSSLIPSDINKKETLFLTPRLTTRQSKKVVQECKQRGLKVWSGRYNGPDDLCGFKAVLFFPYAYSNLAVFENIQSGLVHFMPTKKFLLDLGYVWDQTLRKNLNWCEWYNDRYKDIFIYFDSWQDLANKVSSINYDYYSDLAKKYSVYHSKKALADWQALFKGFGLS